MIATMIKISYSLKTTIQKAYITEMHLKDQSNLKNKIPKLQSKSQRKTPRLIYHCSWTNCKEPLAQQALSPFTTILAITRKTKALRSFKIKKQLLNLSLLKSNRKLFRFLMSRIISLLWAKLSLKNFSLSSNRYRLKMLKNCWSSSKKIWTSLMISKAHLWYRLMISKI